MMDMLHLPDSIHKTVKNGKPAVHPDADITVRKSAKNQHCTVDQHVLRIDFLFIERKILPPESNFLALFHLKQERL